LTSLNPGRDVVEDRAAVVAEDEVAKLDLSADGVRERRFLKG
jgi:hypothetical protein